MCRGQQRRLEVMERTKDWVEEKEGVQGSRETIRNEQDFSLLACEHCAPTNGIKCSLLLVDPTFPFHGNTSHLSQLITTGLSRPKPPPLSRTGLPHPPKSGRMLTLFYGRHLQPDNLMLNGHPKNKLLARWRQTIAQRWRQRGNHGNLMTSNHMNDSLYIPIG